MSDFSIGCGVRSWLFAGRHDSSNEARARNACRRKMCDGMGGSMERRQMRRVCYMSVPSLVKSVNLEIPFHYHDMEEWIVDCFSNGEMNIGNATSQFFAWISISIYNSVRSVRVPQGVVLYTTGAVRFHQVQFLGLILESAYCTVVSLQCSIITQHLHAVRPTCQVDR